MSHVCRAFESGWSSSFDEPSVWSMKSSRSPDVFASEVAAAAAAADAIAAAWIELRLGLIELRRGPPLLGAPPIELLRGRPRGCAPLPSTVRRRPRTGDVGISADGYTADFERTRSSAGEADAGASPTGWMTVTTSSSSSSSDTGSGSLQRNPTVAMDCERRGGICALRSH